VVGERICDPRADQPFDRGIGLGHERPVGLRVDLEVTPEMGACDLVGLVTDRHGHLEPLAQLRVGTTPA
jgi:hypothetical protein